MTILVTTPIFLLAVILGSLKITVVVTKLTFNTSNVGLATAATCDAIAIHQRPHRTTQKDGGFTW